MDLKTAQNDMANAYVNGAPGVAVSGLAWIVAGLVWMRAGIQTGFTALFIGGMLIVPLSLVAARLLFRAPKPAKDNPLERLALESTFTLFAGIVIAYGLLQVAPAAAFPIMAIIIARAISCSVPSTTSLCTERSGPRWRLQARLPGQDRHGRRAVSRLSSGQSRLFSRLPCSHGGGRLKNQAAPSVLPALPTPAPKGRGCQDRRGRSLRASAR